MKLSEKLADFAEEKGLFAPGDSLLLAVSGGVDSMVLLHLLHDLGYAPVIAHVNFGLRGEESDEDEQFVKEVAGKYQFPFITIRFNTADYAAQHKLSIQEAARDLRYAWLEEERVKRSAACIVTAHHANDAIETMLLNLVRGTGLRGLTGIPVRNAQVVRPLLFAFREEILAYASEHNIGWREDSSNASTHYHRNFIRHEIVPRLKELNPSIEHTLAETLGRLEQAERVYRQGIQRMRTELVHFDEALDCFKISFLELASRNITPELMYEIVRDFDFHADQAAAMLEACFTQPGKRFYSAGSVAVVDRMFIFIRDRQEGVEEEEFFTEKDILRNDHPELIFEVVEGNTYGGGDGHEAWLDYDLLQFPLEYRVWKPGDSFVPLGMKGKKKVSDFLVDAKVDRERKESVKVLVSNDKLAWLAGFRVAHDFRVTPGTQRMLHITIR